MDSDRFDGLVRTFGQTRSRRQALRGLAGIVAAGVLVLDGREAAAGKRRIGGSPCTKGRQCKTGKCVGGPGAKTCTCPKKYPRCVPDTSCEGNVCTPTSTCLALNADCTDAAQCCQNDGELECAPISNPSQNQCCSLLGGARSTPGAFDECCGIVEGGSLVFCGPNNTRGGAGAMCNFSSTCASGVCFNDFTMPFGVCCAAGQSCQLGQCVR